MHENVTKLVKSSMAFIHPSLSSRIGALVLFLIFSGLLPWQKAYAQNLDLISKITSDLKTSKGKERFELLNNLAWEYRSAFPDSAIKYGEQALVLGRELQLSRGPATTLNYIGLAHYYKGNFVQAYEFYDRALKEATLSSDSIEIGYSNNNIGRLFSEQGMLTQSYPYFVTAETMFQDSKDDDGLAYVYQSFGAVHRTQKDFVKAEQSYRRALAIRERAGNTRDITSAMVLLGKMYVDANRFDDALLYFTKADSASQVIDDALAQAEIKILISEYHLSKNDLEEAERLTLEGLAYILNFKNVKLLPRAYLVLGVIQFEKKEYKAAGKFFTIAKDISTRMKHVDLKMQSHYYLWKLAEINQNRKEVLAHSNEYLVLKDSLNNIDISGRMAKFQFQLEIERKQRENELLRSHELENQATILAQNQQRIGLMLLLTLAGAILYFQWRHARRMKATNVALLIQKNHIESQAEEIKTQLDYIEVKHSEAVMQQHEIQRINTQLSEKVDEITLLNGALQSHLTTLLNFSKSKSVNFGSMEDAAQDIAKLTAGTLSVSRVSIWSFNEEANTIESIVVYDRASDTFHDKIILSLSQFPNYAAALHSKRIINADDARTDIDTRDFRDSYLLPLNIYSMLDVTYSIDGHLLGLLCCEQQGAPRKWKSEDVLFASSVSDVISLTTRSVQRREYEKRIRHQSKEIARMNELLEQRVKERTMELESQNKLLTEYAFINSHLLRSPVSKILGLVNLMQIDNGSDHKDIMAFLKTACEELDTVVKRITIALDGGEHFDRDAIKSSDKNVQEPPSTTATSV
jgi:tetratricopeptide (TPR) repeat protein